MVYIEILLSFAVFIPSVISNCQQSSRENSDMAFTNQMIPNFVILTEDCGDLRNGRTDVCSNKCKDRVNFMKVKYPWFVDCDCEQDVVGLYSTTECLADRQRLPICFEPENSCSKMYKVCNDSSTCRTNLNDYLSSCNDEFDTYEIGCATVCMFDFNELKLNPDADGLWDCTCDERSQGWCHKFINKTECQRPDYSMSEYSYSDTTSVVVNPEPMLPMCTEKMKQFCNGDLRCQNVMGGNLLELVECDQTNGEGMYNCSSECAIKVTQMKERYQFLYECDCQDSLPTYHTDICNRDAERYEYCLQSVPDPSCSEVLPCLNGSSSCSTTLSNFLANCSYDMFSKDTNDVQCTLDCRLSLDRLSNSTDGVQLKQCRCDKHDKLCSSFQNDDICEVLMPSTGHRLSAGSLMKYFVLFITVGSYYKRLERQMLI